ncbi:hypothetical protein PAXINDRAFT_170035 [Paxillus involutus ATCC 200175]|uniref:Major facilitator superfamily (MFS) profile domain-containing protein n=1 Tax=Paxillus involutus ATCC 200175 TaxID=664439 RepID=A0A0C9TE48_PAXIN|nr:hypothetical protein PAXINDRAFT_170035 [Paxillus involutus ATCC 200175]
MCTPTIILVHPDAFNFAGALASRFFLGFCEAAWQPGTTFLLSRWCKRSELAWRISIITSGSSLGYAFGALIASGVMGTMDKVFGFAGWRWLFLLEGGVTIIIAVFAISVTRLLRRAGSHEELALARKRVEEDACGSDHLDQAKYLSTLTQALTDWRIWSLSTALLCIYAADSFGNFLPTLSATMGYSPTISLLLCVPPWIFSTITAFIVASHSDSSGERFWHMCIPLLITGFVHCCSLSISARAWNHRRSP